MDTEPEPIAFFLIASMAGRMASHMEGNPEDATFAEIRDSYVRPALISLLEADPSDNPREFLKAANDAIRRCSISV